MPWTTKLLVIANRTVASDEIRDVILGRAATGPVQVTIVVPAASGSGPRGSLHDGSADRLDQAMQALRDVGVPVEGILGHADPMVAVHEIWDPRRFDEVIVATLPTGASRWMAADLPRRIERFTGALVTHVVAGEAPLARVARSS